MSSYCNPCSIMSTVHMLLNVMFKTATRQGVCDFRCWECPPSEPHLPLTDATSLSTHPPVLPWHPTQNCSPIPFVLLHKSYLT